MGFHLIAGLLVLFHIRFQSISDSITTPQEIIAVEVVGHTPNQKWSKSVFKDLQSGEHILARHLNPKISITTGDTILVEGKWKQIQNSGLQGDFDAVNYYHSKQIHFEGFCTIERHFYNSGYTSPPILHSLFDDLQISHKYVMVAMLTGDKSRLTKEQKNLFKSCGVMHILAVSGMHVGLIAALPLLLIRILKRKRRLMMLLKLISLALIWSFACFTGFGASVIRAATMFSICILMQNEQNPLQGLNCLFATAFLMLLYSPNYISDLGFQLSFVAVFGIMTIPKLFKPWLNRQPRILRLPLNALILSTVAQLSTAPLILFHFHEIPSYSLLSSICLAPLMVLSSYVVLGVVVSYFMRIPNKVLIDLLDYLIQLIEDLAGIISSLPYSMTAGYFPSTASLLLGLSLIIWLGIKAVVSIEKPKVFICRMVLFSCIYLGFQALDTEMTKRTVQLSNEEIVVFRKQKMLLLISKKEIKPFRLRSIEKLYNLQSKSILLPEGISEYDFALLETSLKRIDSSIVDQRTPPNTSAQ